MPGRLSLSFAGNSSSSSSSSSSKSHASNGSISTIDSSYYSYGKRRLGMSGRAGFRSSAYGSNPGTLDMTIESPPLVCYGAPKDSTGALLSGLMHLAVHEPKIKVATFSLVLLAEIHTRRPLTSHCPNCSNKKEEVNKWSIISEPITLAQGVHSYPFSYHIPGTIPASNSNSLGSIKYFLRAAAFTSGSDEIKFMREITISRAILSVSDRHSVRIFPPTNLSAHMNLPSIIHPNGDFPLTMRLDGIRSPERETRWRLRKISWKIEEHSQVIAPACAHHPSRVCGNGKGIQHQDTRILSSGDVKTGWKADYGNGGRIEAEFMAGIPLNADAACAIDAPCGIKVNHNLVIELIVSEEHCPSAANRLVTPTGAARVLRMQFNLIVTARGGLGISWDEEQPPIYENVPPAPPRYVNPGSSSVPQDSPPVYEGVSVLN